MRVLAFHWSGKLRASSSETLFTTKSLKRNQGLVKSSLSSASGTIPKISIRKLEVRKLIIIPLTTATRCEGLLFAFTCTTIACPIELANPPSQERITYSNNIRSNLGVINSIYLTVKIDLNRQKWLVPAILPKLPSLLIVNIGVDNQYWWQKSWGNITFGGKDGEVLACRTGWLVWDISQEWVLQDSSKFSQHRLFVVDLLRNHWSG